VGIPRALNMYENYPFWFTFFTKLGFRVILSDPSTEDLRGGHRVMPSENVCYPAKLSHGHIMNLLEKHPDFIWMPCIRWERQEDHGANNHYNCPMVVSYSEALKPQHRRAAHVRRGVPEPVLPYDKKENLKERLFEELVENNRNEHDEACARADAGGDRPRRGPGLARRRAVQDDMRAKGEETLAGWRRRARTASCWPGARTTTTPRSTTPSPSC
jgi:predicted nucleotide-binding protein (sugar kinase/HSP70/actin superfamily)